MNPRRKKRLTLAVALIVGVAAIASLLLYALNSNLNLFFTPTEIVQGKKDTGVMPEIGQRIRVGGTRYRCTRRTCSPWRTSSHRSSC